jgi:hypothetical protein
MVKMLEVIENLLKSSQNKKGQIFFDFSWQLRKKIQKMVQLEKCSALFILWWLYDLTFLLT